MAPYAASGHWPGTTASACNPGSPGGRQVQGQPGPGSEAVSKKTFKENMLDAGHSILWAP
jgi:hypothetical protein